MYVTRFITSKIAWSTQDKKALSGSLSRRRDLEVPSMIFILLWQCYAPQSVTGWRGRIEPTFLVISAWLPNSQPMLHKMYIPRRKVSSSRYFPSPSSYSPGSIDMKNMLWKLADRCKCSQPLGESFPIPPRFLCCWGGKLNHRDYPRPSSLQCCARNVLRDSHAVHSI